MTYSILYGIPQRILQLQLFYILFQKPARQEIADCKPEEAMETEETVEAKKKEESESVKENRKKSSGATQSVKKKLSKSSEDETWKGTHSRKETKLNLFAYCLFVLC